MYKFSTYFKFNVLVVGEKKHRPGLYMSNLFSFGLCNTCSKFPILWRSTLEGDLSKAVVNTWKSCLPFKEPCTYSVSN